MRDSVAVIRGGRGTRYDTSLKSGARILQSLDPEKVSVRDIFIDRDNQWHVSGIKISPERALRGVDVAMATLHDHALGRVVHSQLDSLFVPHIGTRHEELSTLADRGRVFSRLAELGLNVPRHAVVHTHENTPEKAFSLFRTFPQPSILRRVKYETLRATLAEHFHAFEWGLETLGKDSSVLVEEFILGRQVSVGIVDNLRNSRHYITLPLEIIHKKSRGLISDEDASQPYLYEAPARVSAPERRQITDIAVAAYTELKLRDYAMINLVVGRHRVFVVGIDALPDLSELSCFSKALEASGVSINELSTHMFENAGNNRT